MGRLAQTNNQINKRKQKTHTKFHHDVLRDSKYGNGFGVNCIIELEAQKRVPGIRKKRNTSLSYQMTPNLSSKDNKLIPPRNSHITNALNLITYVYMCKSST